MQMLGHSESRLQPQGMISNFHYSQKYFEPPQLRWFDKNKLCSLDELVLNRETRNHKPNQIYLTIVDILLLPGKYHWFQWN